jgi:L-arabinonolactonase
MNEAADHAPIGHIYQFSKRHGLRRIALGTVGISNSICFSPEGTTMYFCDSTQRRIVRGVYDSEAAAVTDVTAIVSLEPGQGMPNGSVVDSEGTIWNAQWGGAAVRRYSPEGNLLATSPLPAAHVTCPAFGGHDLRELCATTARMDVPDRDLADRPETGSVFRIEAHGAVGLADCEFED